MTRPLAGMATSYVTLPVATGYVTDDRISNKLGRLAECEFSAISNCWLFRARISPLRWPVGPRNQRFGLGLVNSVDTADTQLTLMPVSETKCRRCFRVGEELGG